ncbi:hypothetical protein AB1L05_16705 [Cytobacillus horneckiae]|uniref:hypothetical protein n=1 Tax=Cytobacillus horneckiae TaxID=549687 RepID=UPI0039A0A4D5
MSFNLVAVDDFFNVPERVYELFNTSSIDRLATENIDLKIKEIFNDENLNVNSLKVHSFEDGEFKCINFTEEPWSIISYLGDDDYSNTRISLYRHKSTGLTTPPNEMVLKKIGFSSFMEWKNELFNRDRANLEMWEITTQISFEYNRAVLLNTSNLFYRIENVQTDNSSYYKKITFDVE